MGIVSLRCTQYLATDANRDIWNLTVVEWPISCELDRLVVISQMEYGCTIWRSRFCCSFLVLSTRWETWIYSKDTGLCVGITCSVRTPCTDSYVLTHASLLSFSRQFLPRERVRTRLHGSTTITLMTSLIVDKCSSVAIENLFILKCLRGKEILVVSRDKSS